MNHLEEFKDRLKELMEINGETAQGIMQKTGLLSSRIYQFLNGKHAPSLKNALVIADYFQCPLDYLFGFCDEFEKKDRKVIADFHSRLKIAIERSGKSRYQIAKEAKIDDQQIHNWYHGNRIPTLVSLVKLAEPLNCSLEFLAGRE